MMPKYKVDYSETRYYSVEVEAEDEDDAIEVAELTVDANPSNWQFSNEEYEVLDVTVRL